MSNVFTLKENALHIYIQQIISTVVADLVYYAVLQQLVSKCSQYNGDWWHQG